MQRVNVSLIVKINFLLLGLGLVAYIMYSLNTRGLPQPVADLFGAGGSGFNWCETRIQGIIRPDEYKLEQVGKQWVVEKEGEPRTANFLEIEKWFVEYCKIPGEVQAVQTLEGFRPGLVIKFVTGRIEVLRQGPDDLFTWKGQTLVAPKMTEAIAALTSLTADQQTSKMPEIPEESEP